MSRRIAITALVHEGPIARATIALLGQAGYRLERIVQLVQDRAPGHAHRIGRWLPGRSWRQHYAARVQDIRNNYWVREIRRRHPRLYESMRGRICEHLHLPPNLFNALFCRFEPSHFADETEVVSIDGLSDPRLEAVLMRLAPATLLFTGGGLVPSRLIDAPGLRFLHVHPGYLPEVRGADGLLWSTLSRGRPGASCLFLSRDIDTGNILLANEFEPLTFPMFDRPTLDDLTLYRAVFAYYDPFLRAATLLRTLEGAGASLQFTEIPQNPLCGQTFRFMHPRLRQIALARLFPSD